MITPQLQSGISPPKETAIIGRLPGYNTNIDTNGQFVSQLLKGLTFIDLIPTSYRASIGATDAITNLGALLSKGTPFSHMSGETEPTKIFKNVLKGMEAGLKLDGGFADVNSIRIIGANDSTFTENLANSFDGVNVIDTGLAAAKSRAKEGAIGKLVSAIKSYNHENAVKIFTDQSMANNTLTQIAKGTLMGVNFARPSTWQQSQYTSTLTMFIKLVSPSGHEECIKRNILAPIMYLLAAGSPLTVHGFAYGLPMLWDVRAHGITRFKAGSIAAMTISRGSFETTFNDKYQPTVIDIRLTIIPLLQDFAVEHNTNTPGKLYKDDGSLGVQHPGDIYTGTINSKVKSVIDKTPSAVKIIQL